MVTGSEPVRIANCSGFYGDRLAAALEMVQGGPIHYLTGDYLAELTMMILWKTRLKDPSQGYAKTFLAQMEQTLAQCLDKGIRVVTNAGGLNPAGLAKELRALCDRLGVKAQIAHIEGDDLLPRLEQLQQAGHPLKNMQTRRSLAELAVQPLCANAYLGAWGIVQALDRGADIVVCPRVTDASVIIGPAAHHFGWKRDDWDELAGALAAGHVVECGTQATGGNYAFFKEVPGLEHPGFPLCEMYPDGSSVITKHPGTGGLVSRGTVTAQLLYEIEGPTYYNPDVVGRFDTVQLEELGDNRVRIFGTRGLPAPDSIKVCINYLGGFRNSMTCVLTGLDIPEKAALVERTLRNALGDDSKFSELKFDLVRSDRPDADRNSEAVALLHITAKSPNQQLVGRAFSNKVVEMVLASYPGFYCTAPPADGTPFGVYWPALVPASEVHQEVVLEDGTRLPIEPTSATGEKLPEDASLPGEPTTQDFGPTQRLPLGTIIGARSGDKGGYANVGLWARNPAAYDWLRQEITLGRFRELLPEAEGLKVRRYEFPHLWALNFVVEGLLGEGVSSSTRFDPQAKGLGEYLRCRLVDIPESLLDAS